MGIIERIIGEEPSLLNQWLNCDDTGTFGEYMTEYALTNDNISGYSKVLKNIYVPYRNKTSEIDLIMIHEKGIYVFESKNYSGWIFGKNNQTYWTQCLINKEKKKIYNPIYQNRTHINALVNYTKLNPNKFKSYIVFSKRCELKNIPNNTEEYTITKRNNLLDSLRSELSDKTISFTKEAVDKIYTFLFPLTQVTEEQKLRHIKEIKKS